MHAIEGHLKVQSASNLPTSCMSLNEDCNLGATESGSSKSKSAEEKTHMKSLGKIKFICSDFRSVLHCKLNITQNANNNN